MALEEKLQELNIPERESQVYLALLQQGMTTVGPIVNKTRLHRMLVYQSLEKLKDMNMASMVVKNGRQHWHATNPSVLLDKLEKQERLAKTLVSELDELRDHNKDDTHVQILYGRNGLLENLEACIKSAAATDKTMRILGGMSDKAFYDLVGDWYPTYIQLQKQYNVRKNLIAPSTHASGFKRHCNRKQNDEFRFLASGLDTPAFHRFTKEMVSIEVYSSQPIVVQMHNKTIARSYIDSFDLLWKQADPMK